MDLCDNRAVVVTMDSWVDLYLRSIDGCSLDILCWVACPGGEEESWWGLLM